MSRVCLLLLLIFISDALKAQELPCRTRNYTITAGLPNSTVIDIAQDHQSFLWLATNNGISRFDGIYFDNYYPSQAADPEASTRDTPVLHVGHSGTVWLGYGRASAKLFRYDIARDTFLPFAQSPAYCHPPIPPEIAVRAIHESLDSSLWVATAGAGLIRFSLERQGDTLPYQYFQAVAGDTTTLPTDFLGSGLYEAADGQLWISTDDGLAVRDEATGSFSTYRWSKEEAGNEVLGILPDSARQCIWLATFYGLLRLDTLTGETRLFSPPNRRSSEEIRYLGSLQHSGEGGIWLNHDSYPASQLWLFDPDAETFLKPVTTVGDKVEQLPGANKLFCDQQGRVWSGGFRRGLQVVDPWPGNVERLRLTSGTAKVFDVGGVTAITSFHEHLIFLGTAAQGLWQWDPATDIVFPVSIPALDRAPVRIFDLAIAPDKKALYLVAGKQSFRLPLQAGPAQLVPAFTNFQEHSIYLRARFFAERLWLSCFDKGLYVKAIDSEKGSLKFFNTKTATNEPQPLAAFGSITDMQPGNAPGQLWLSSVFAGLLEWNESTQTFTEHPLSSTIRRFFVATDGLIWLATDAGLERYDPNSKRMVSDPFLSNKDLRQPRSFVEDKDGLLWIAAENGLVAVKPLLGEVVHRLNAASWTKGRNDWYAPEVFSYHQEETGHLFFANMHGVFRVDPGEIRYDTLPPKVALKGLTVNGSKVVLPEPDELFDLSYDQNDLKFDVVALHYKSPEKNQLRYRLDDFDAEWRIAPSGQMLEYPNLPPATYSLSVMAGNADGIQTPPLTVAVFRIKAPWFANGMAYLTYLSLFIGGVFFLFKQQLKQRRQKAERKFLQELDASKTYLFTNISHEFRTPLTLILGDAKNLIKKLDGKLLDSAERIQRGGQLLLWLVNQLLELAQADSGFLRLAPKQAEIIPFLRYNLQAFESLAMPRGIELKFVDAVGQLKMDFDAARLQRVISNLLLNAVKFTPDDGEIELMADYQELEGEQRLRIRITDSGSGIAPEELKLIFNRFHRSTDLQGGAGIGLALAKEIIDLMGGDISAANSPDGGALFTTVLPISQKAPSANETKTQLPLISAVSSEMVANEPVFRQAKLPVILIIEDNADLRPYIRSCLEEDYQLTLAHDGEEGLDLALDQNFDLIISDVMMPRMDGFTVCQRIKENLGTSHIPFILLTARVDQRSRLEGFSRGADAYLPKPFDPEELRLRCKQLLEQRERFRVYLKQLLKSKDEIRPFSLGRGGDQAFIIKAKSIIHDHLDDSHFSVETLANALHLSRSQLHRKLDQMIGMNTTKFIRTVRLQAASTLLHDRSYTIAEVAFACGFRDPDYFSRVFKEEVGQSPSAYRSAENDGDDTSSGQ